MFPYASLMVYFIRVPNIKFTAAKVLESLIPVVDHAVSECWCVLIYLVDVSGMFHEEYKIYCLCINSLVSP